jgi:hypothetical protein
MNLRSESDPDETRCLELVKLEAEVSKSSTASTVCEQGPHSAYPFPCLVAKTKLAARTVEGRSPIRGRLGRE